MSKHMRTFAVLAVAVALAACSRGASAPDALKLPLLAGAYTFVGVQMTRECTGFDNGQCAQQRSVWAGYPHGTLTFGDTIPGTLHGDASSGQVDVALSGKLTGTDLYYVTDFNYSSASLFVAPARSATLMFENGVVQSVTFNVVVLNQNVVPSRERPPFMEFALMHAGPDNFEGGSEGRTLYVSGQLQAAVTIR
jgi:hypothetical protein